MKRYVLLLSLSLSAGLLILLLSILGLLEPIELRTLDWRFGLRGSRDPSSDISIVLVERRYVKSLARSSYAKFLTLYREASSIGFDLIFDQPNDEAYRDEDL